MKKPCFLITAFEPFGNRRVNRSLQILEALRDVLQDSISVKYLVLPVVTKKAGEAIGSILSKDPPDFLISLGEAGRETACLEQRGVNQKSFRMPDNEGNQPANEPIVAEGPDSYPSTLPYSVFVSPALEPKVFEFSDNAGGFLCNEILYSSLHKIKTTNLKTKAGFIHVPDSEAGIEKVTEAVAYGIINLTQNNGDINGV